MIRQRKSPPGCWVESFRCESGAGSHDGLALPQLMDIMQLAAGHHARALGVSIPALESHNLTWVLARLAIGIEVDARWRPELRVETWPSGRRGYLALRDFLVHSGSSVLARATSAWCVIDVERRRPARLPGAVRAIELEQRPRARHLTLRTLPVPERADRELGFEVGESDLDINRHVNNVRYPAWALATLPEAFLRRHRLADLEVEFKSETLVGERLSARVQILEGEGATTSVHQLVREDGSREAARILGRWVDRLA